MEKHPFAILATATSEFLDISKEAATELITRGNLKITEYYGKGKGFLVKYSCESITEADQQLLEKVVKAAKGLSTNAFVPKNIEINPKEVFAESMTDFINKYFEADDCLVHDDGNREKHIYETWKFAKFLKNRKDSIDTPEYKFVSTIENHIEEFVSYVREDKNTSKVFQVEHLSKIMFSVECFCFNDFLTRFLKKSLGFVSYVDFAMIMNAKKTVYWILRQKGIKSKTYKSFPYLIFVDNPPDTQKMSVDFNNLKTNALYHIMEREDLQVLLALSTESLNGDKVFDSILSNYFQANSSNLNDFFVNNIFMLCYSEPFSKRFFECCCNYGKMEFAEKLVKRAFEEFKHKVFPYTVIKKEINYAIENIEKNDRQTCFSKFIEDNHVYLEKPYVSVTDPVTKIVGLFEEEDDGLNYHNYKEKLQKAAEERVANSFCNDFVGPLSQYYNEHLTKRLEELRKEHPDESDEAICDIATKEALVVTREYSKEFIPLINKKTEALRPEDKIYHLYLGAQISQHDFANNQLLMRILKDLDNDEYMSRHYRVDISHLIALN